MYELKKGNFLIGLKQYLGQGSDSFSEKQMDRIFAKIKNMFISSKYKLIIIPSYRTPENILKLAYNYFNQDHLVIKERDKKAY